MQCWHRTLQGRLLRSLFSARLRMNRMSIVPIRSARGSSSTSRWTWTTIRLSLPEWFRNGPAITTPKLCLGRSQMKQSPIYDRDLGVHLETSGTLSGPGEDSALKSPIGGSYVVDPTCQIFAAAQSGPRAAYCSPLACVIIGHSRPSERY